METLKRLLPESWTHGYEKVGTNSPTPHTQDREVQQPLAGYVPVESAAGEEQRLSVADSVLEEGLDEGYPVEGEPRRRLSDAVSHEPVIDAVEKKYHDLIARRRSSSERGGAEDTRDLDQQHHFGKAVIEVHPIPHVPPRHHGRDPSVPHLKVPPRDVADPVPYGPGDDVTEMPDAEPKETASRRSGWWNWQRTREAGAVEGELAALMGTRTRRTSYGTEPPAPPHDTLAASVTDRDPLVPVGSMAE